MKDKWILGIATATGLVGLCLVFTFISPLSLMSPWESMRPEVKHCRPLPDGFTESDLVGTWVGRYFGDTDTLTVREDGRYKQVFKSDTINFESDWLNWSFDFDSEGYGRLDLYGLRRCDDHDGICNNPGGGFPSGDLAVNPCAAEFLSYPNKVVLMVTGIDSEVPRGIVFRQARLSGTEWGWGYKLQEQLDTN